METNSYDVAIVGGGAAGLSAALVLGRARRRVVVIDAGAPRNAPAAHMHGFLSRDGMPPAELLAAGTRRGPALRRRARRGRVVGRDGRASRAARRRPAIARATIPARDRRRRRAARDPRRSASAGGATSSTARTATAGRCATGRSACSDRPGSVEHAHLLRQWSDDVVLFTHTYAVTEPSAPALHARGIGVVDGVVERLVVATTACSGVSSTTAATVPRDALFMRPALRARATPARRAGLRARRGGLRPRRRRRPDQRARRLGAGNAANPRAQVITAAGEGSAVAIAINADLVQEDIAPPSASPLRPRRRPEEHS